MRLSTAKNILKKAIIDQLKTTRQRAAQLLVPYLQGVWYGKTTWLRMLPKRLARTRQRFSSVHIIAKYDPAEAAGWLMPNNDKTAMIKLA